MAIEIAGLLITDVVIPEPHGILLQGFRIQIPIGPDMVEFEGSAAAVAVDVPVRVRAPGIEPDR